MHYTALNTRQLMVLTGEDLIPFLQGLISNDARRLEKGETIYATLLTPQGKFLHDFFLLPWQGGILLDCARARSEELRKRLLMYKLRSRVSIEAMPDHVGVVALWGGQISSGDKNFSGKIIPDPRLAALGYRLVGDRKETEAWLAGQAAVAGDYDAMRIALGVPEGGVDLIPEKSFLLEWGIDQLHGVDYAKGCYVGQEVTARTHYRGQVKKAPYLIQSDSSLPEGTHSVLCGETEAGEMRSSSGKAGLALLRIEEVEKSISSGMPLRIGEQVVTASLPPWFALSEVA